MRLRFIVMLAAGLLSLGFVACGGDDDSSDGGSGESADTPAQTTQEPTTDEGSSAGAVAVAADPGGKLEYEPENLESGTGEVTFEFTNDSSVPHDFVIEEGEEKVAGTDVISKDKATLEADLEAGDYTFYCSVANHRESGMEGKLTAK